MTETIKRRSRTLKTHCPSGHEFTPHNTKTNSRGYRQCRACVLNHSRTRNAKDKARAAESLKKVQDFLAQPDYPNRTFPPVG